MQRKKIGDILIEKGLITAAQLEDALSHQKTTGGKLGEILVQKRLITEEQLTVTISERLNIPKISLNALVIDPRVISTVPVEVARRYSLIPIFRIGNVLTVAMSDPLNIIALDELKYITQCDVRRVVSLNSEIKAAIEEYYSVADSMSEVIRGYPELGAAKTPEPSPVASRDSDAPVVRLVDLIINRAVKEHASDIHIEPDEKSLRIRYRVNGVMKEEASPPKALQAELISRIKVAAELDVSERRLPQDGRMMARVDDFDIDLRISTLPTIHGEKVVIRILDKRILRFGLEDLGFTPEILDRWRTLIQKKEGIILITGPTSSGKTTTLYSVLQELNSAEKNIITVEDPVEYSIPFINQVQVNEKAGLTFAGLLRHILRQNPDIVMIGEIRDTETAMMALRSALTGQLVFSTLHTNDAPASITRLIDMGLEKYLAASALEGILAQRLVRSNCPHCKESYRPDFASLRLANLENSLDKVDFKHGVGCNKCRMTGYLGQTGIYELLTVDDAVYEMIISGAPETQIRDYIRRQGYKPLFEAGLEKVRSGQISLEELLRVITIGETYLATPERVASFHA